MTQIKMLKQYGLGHLHIRICLGFGIWDLRFLMAEAVSFFYHRWELELR